MHFIDNAKVTNPKKHLNNSKLLLNLKALAKLCDLFINSIKKIYSVWFPHAQYWSSHGRDLAEIRNKLADDKIDCVLEKVTVTTTLNIT